MTMILPKRKPLIVSRCYNSLLIEILNVKINIEVSLLLFSLPMLSISYRYKNCCLQLTHPIQNTMNNKSCTIDYEGILFHEGLLSLPQACRLCISWSYLEKKDSLTVIDDVMRCLGNKALTKKLSNRFWKLLA